MVQLQTAPAPRAERARRRRRALLPPIVVGVAGTLAVGALSWVPSLWYDEGATVSGATRSIPQLLHLLTNVDAVHGAYYLAMHLWFGLVGYSPFTLRLPSAIAIGLTAALLVVLARRLLGTRTGVIAGIIFCLLPRTTWAGTEGRSYALTCLLAVAATLLLLRAVDATLARRPDRLAWVAYTVVAVLSCIVFVYLALLIAAHAVLVLARMRHEPGSVRRLGSRWLLSVGIAAALAAPLVVVEAHQTGQISWIHPLNATTLRYVLVGQWATDNVAFAVVALTLAAAGAVALALLSRRATDAGRRATVALATALSWLVVPTAALLLVSATLTPTYSPRYVTFSAPALAILIAVVIASLPRRWPAIVALVALAALSAPTWVAQRAPQAKQHASWSAVADLVATERAAEPAGQRDAVIYGPLRDHPDATMQLLAVAYPQQFAGLDDVKAGTAAADRGTLWESRVPLAEVRTRVDASRVVWLVTSDKRDWRPGVTAQLAQWGYAPDGEWHFTGANVLRFTPAPAIG